MVERVERFCSPTRTLSQSCAGASVDVFDPDELVVLNPPVGGDRRSPEGWRGPAPRRSGVALTRFLAAHHDELHIGLSSSSRCPCRVHLFVQPHQGSRPRARAAATPQASQCGGAHAPTEATAVAGDAPGPRHGVQRPPAPQRTTCRCSARCRGSTAGAPRDQCDGKRAHRSRRAGRRQTNWRDPSAAGRVMALGRPDSVWTARGFETGALRSPKRALLCCGRCTQIGAHSAFTALKAMAGIVQNPIST